MPQIEIKVFRKGQVPPFNKHPLELLELWIMEGSTSSGNASVAFHFRDHKNEEYACETTAKIADGMSGAIVSAQLQFSQKPLGIEQGVDYFGFFNTLKNKMRLLYFKTPEATEAGWQEYSKDLVIEKMIGL